MNIVYPIEDHIIVLSKLGKDYKMYLKETVLLFHKRLQATEVLELLPIYSYPVSDNALKNTLLLGIHIVNIAYPIEDHLDALSNHGKDYKMYLKETVLLFPKAEVA